MLIYYNCFWAGFSNDTSDIDKLFSDIFSTEINSTRNINDADILCESVYFCWEPTLISQKTWAYSFMLSFENHYGGGEDWLDKYTCVIGGPYKSKNTVPFPYFLFRCLQCTDVTFELDSYEPIHVPNKKVCAVITNSKSELRTKFLNYLDELTKIDYGGSYKNNIGGIIGGHHGSLELIDFYKQYKFAITIENSAGDTYITEKIFNGLRAGVIPIYWGSQNIGDLINTERIIQIHNDTPEEFARVAELINNMSDETYAAIIEKPVFVKPFQHIYKQTIQHIQKCIVGGQNI
jgi:hypothetical protein